MEYQRAGLGVKGEWDPHGVLFFIKRFESAFDQGDVCLIWSGLDVNGKDQYAVSVSFTTMRMAHVFYEGFNPVPYHIAVHDAPYLGIFLQIKLLNLALRPEKLHKSEAVNPPVTFGAVRGIWRSHLRLRPHFITDEC